MDKKRINDIIILSFICCWILSSVRASPKKTQKNDTKLQIPEHIVYSILNKVHYFLSLYAVYGSCSE